MAGRSFCQNKHMLFVVTLPTSRCWGIVAAWINKTNSRSNNLSSKAILNISALREHQINVYALTYNCSTVFLKGLSWWVQNRTSNLTCAKETPSYTFLKKHLHLMEWVRLINRNLPQGPVKSTTSLSYRRQVLHTANNSKTTYIVHTQQKFNSTFHSFSLNFSFLIASWKLWNYQQ